MISLKKRISRTAALVMAGASLFTQPVFADTVEVASMPTVQGTAAQGTTVTANSGENFISSTGPTESKQYDENGIFVYNAGTGLNSTDSISTIGPGGSVSQSGSGQTSSGETTAATQPSADNTQGASGASGPLGSSSSGQTSATAPAGSASGQITIDPNIAKPEITAESAILYDPATGQVIFEKNADEKLYPASTTKLMTALLAVENLDLNSKITINASAVDNLESGATTAGMKAGDTMTVNDALHAILIKSACEVANALGEAVSGSQQAFADLMNKRAAELGCTNTHFANASGLNDTDHYSTVRDMALITKAALANDTIRNMTLTKTYTLPATSSRGELSIINTCRFVTGAESLEGYLGGKTGYTSKAGSCLASEAKVGDRQLIAVVFKAQAPQQYSDTKKLYEYASKLMGISQTSGSQSAGGNASGNSGSTQTGPQGSSQSTSGGWEKTADGQYKYKKADGTYCTNEWLDLGQNSYFFDGNSIMCTGWKQFTNGSWYYFNPADGTMVTDKWVVQNGKSYYLKSDGTMAVNTIVNGMYQVDENGVYIKKVG